MALIDQIWMLNIHLGMIVQVVEDRTNVTFFPKLSMGVVFPQCKRIRRRKA